MKIFTFWNNKGGTGKTSLAFQTICRYAEKNQNEKILLFDICPQANLSELFLGGLEGNGSRNLLQRQGEIPRATIGGYFQDRLPSPYTMPNLTVSNFITKPHDYNQDIPSNIFLVCGDPLLELQSNAISTLANTQIPGTDTWIRIIDWLDDLIKLINKQCGAYDVIFIDTNPSFSIYTQMALATTQKLLLPVMADDSSRRAIQNAFSLIYGLELPSEIYTRYAFSSKLKEADRDLPKVHMVINNRLTQYMGPASAYMAVLKSIEADYNALKTSHPDIFSTDNKIVNIRDFQTTGVISHARGCPFFRMTSGNLSVQERRVQVKPEYLQNCTEAIDLIVNAL